MAQCLALHHGPSATHSKATKEERASAWINDIHPITSTYGLGIEILLAGIVALGCVADDSRAWSLFSRMLKGCMILHEYVRMSSGRIS